MIFVLVFNNMIQHFKLAQLKLYCVLRVGVGVDFFYPNCRVACALCVLGQAVCRSVSIRDGRGIHCVSEIKGLVYTRRSRIH